MIDRITLHTSGDNRVNRRDIAVTAMSRTPLLAALGLADSPDSLRLGLRLPDGTRRSVVLATRETSAPAQYVGLIDSSGLPRPLWLRDTTKMYWFEHLPDHDLVYMQYNQVASDPDDPFGPFCERMFAFIDEHNVRRLVIDMRHNSGGDSQLTWPLMHRAALNTRVNRRGGLYIILGPRSSSAAPSTIKRLDELTDATIVGMPSGGRPNGHGNATPIELPNSQIVFRCSGLLVRPTLLPDNRPWIDPDISAEFSVAEYAAGVDPAMDVILSGQTPRSFFDCADDAAAADAASVIALLAEYRKVPINRWVSVEADIRALGLRMLDAGRVDESIALLAYDAGLHPWSSDAHYALGSATEQSGDLAAAVTSYRGAFELNRSNGNALARLLHLTTATASP